MKKYLAFDTETTGLIDYKKELSDPSQPRITQLAAQLVDEDFNVLDEMCVFIKPDGWTVPAEVTELNGITTELLEQHGIPMVDAIKRFNEMKAQCTHRVAHNATFDKQMLRREAFAYDLEHDSAGTETICTMKLTKDICRIPKAGSTALKNPKLGEAYAHFFGVNNPNPHDAMGDVKACLAVYFAAKKYLEQQGVAA